MKNLLFEPRYECGLGYVNGFDIYWEGTVNEDNPLFNAINSREPEGKAFVEDYNNLVARERKARGYIAAFYHAFPKLKDYVPAEVVEGCKKFLDEGAKI